MKIMLLLVLLSCMRSSALADWELLIATDDVDWYVDQSLTRKRGTMAKVWAMREYKTSQPLYSGDYLSAQTQVEIRCHSKQWRVFYFSYFVGSMGSGALAFTHETAGSWKAVVAGGFSEALFQVGCHPEKR